jgi:hypothetical protein
MPYQGGYPQATGVQCVRGRYDHSKDGGAVGTIDLTYTTAVPTNAIVLGGFVEVDTALTSGGAATVAVKVEGAGDIVAAAAVSGEPWASTGRKDVIPDFSGSAMVKTTTARKVQATIAAAALTAGAFDVVLFYTELPD